MMTSPLLTCLNRKLKVNKKERENVGGIKNLVFIREKRFSEKEEKNFRKEGFNIKVGKGWNLYKEQGQERSQDYEKKKGKGISRDICENRGHRGQHGGSEKLNDYPGQALKFQTGDIRERVAYLVSTSVSKVGHWSEAKNYKGSTKGKVYQNKNASDE